MDSEEHAHIPYIAILGHVMRQLAPLPPSSPPSTYDEKRSFKALIVSRSWDYSNETNFAEAVDFAHRAYDRPTLDRYTEEVYRDEKVKVTKESEAYWIIVAGLRRFMEKEGQGFGVPVSVDIPDMHSKTEWYVTLKGAVQSEE